MPYGWGLVIYACHLILRFAGKYYNEHKEDYTAPQQALIQQLLVAAENIETLIPELLGI